MPPRTILINNEFCFLSTRARKSFSVLTGFLLTEVITSPPRRPRRHAGLIRQVREAGARIHLIQDGDLAAAVATAIGDSGVDVLLGIGSAVAAVLAAAALACVGGDMQCRFAPLKDGDDARIQKLTDGHGTRKYGLLEMVGDGSVMFAATGITDGDVLRGVHFRKGGATTHSVVMRRRSGTIRFIHANHFFERKPRY